MAPMTAYRSSSSVSTPCLADVDGAQRRRPVRYHHAVVRAEATRVVWVVPTAVVLLLASSSTMACRSREAVPAARAKTEPQIVWRPVGSWSGHGDRQTESFHGETG